MYLCTHINQHNLRQKHYTVTSVKLPGVMCTKYECSPINRMVILISLTLGYFPAAYDCISLGIFLQ